MRYHALATDFDGTIAADGTIGERPLAALRRLRASGRRAILITGRRLDDLKRLNPPLDLFDCIVAENGAILYRPETRTVDLLASPPPAAFVDALRRRGVAPLEVGEVVIGTFHPNERIIIDVIRELALELQIVFNQNAVMVLPSRVNKGSGLEAALWRLGLSQHEIVGVGNAANDHSFLQLCEISVAVADAAPAVKSAVSFSTTSSNGDGIVEVIDELIATDLAGRKSVGAGEHFALGMDENGHPVELSPYGHNILVAGPSASGKSTFATGVIERLMDQSYQLCIIDPEGDYGTVEGLTTLGSRIRVPELQEVLSVLRDPTVSVVVNLLGVPRDDRPHFAADLFSRIHAMRVSTGRPHWVIVDEVHHLLPASWAYAPTLLPQRLGETILITMRATEVVEHLIQLMDVVVAVGPAPAETLADVAAALHVPSPKTPASPPQRNEVLIWFRTTGRDPQTMVTMPSRSDRLRHLRKYAEGNLGNRSFFFRGPGNRLNLRAQNLSTFCDLVAGIDDETFLFHLQRGDYTSWIRSVIKDDDLATEIEEIRNDGRPPDEGRALLTDAIDRRYALR